MIYAKIALFIVGLAVALFVMADAWICFNVTSRDDGTHIEEDSDAS